MTNENGAKGEKGAKGRREDGALKPTLPLPRDVDRVRHSALGIE